MSNVFDGTEKKLPKVRGPISPGVVEDLKNETFPKEVFDSFNELIIRNYQNGKSTFTMIAVAELMGENGLDKNKIVPEGWLNIEEVYRGVGWQVEYDKPGYNEFYNGYFIFTKI